MAYLNKIQLIGNTGKDPDVRTFGDGEKIANLSLATTKKYTDRSGQTLAQTTWHGLVLRGRNADVVEKYVRKGDPLYVEGELVSRSYVDGQGLNRTVYEVRVSSLQLLKQRESQDGGDTPDDEDLPF